MLSTPKIQVQQMIATPMIDRLFVLYPYNNQMLKRSGHSGIQQEPFVTF